MSNDLFFYPVEPILILLVTGEYRLSLTSEDQYAEAVDWFKHTGIAAQEVTFFPYGDKSVWKIKCLVFMGKENAVAVRMRWT